MNYLAHLYLAERSATSLAGNFLGDFVKGRPEDRFPMELAIGIRLHRRIDTVTDAHPGVRAARRLLPSPHRRYAGILLDVWFDHALARQWPRWHRTPLPAFATSGTAQIAAAWPHADAPFPPERLDGLSDLLCGYRSPSGIRHSLLRIGARLRGTPRLETALPILQRHDALLAAVFENLMTELVGFARGEAGRLRATAAEPGYSSGIRARKSPR